MKKRLHYLQSKRHWIEDGLSFECFECAVKFTVVLRKHHCRICGRVFCKECCKVRNVDFSEREIKTLKICSYCFTIISKTNEEALSFDPKNNEKSQALTDVITKDMNSSRNFPLPLAFEENALELAYELFDIYDLPYSIVLQ